MSIEVITEQEWLDSQPQEIKAQIEKFPYKEKYIIKETGQIIKLTTYSICLSSRNVIMRGVIIRGHNSGFTILVKDNEIRKYYGESGN